ncbi:MAG TPA: hypothetical protein VFV78_12625 [Vicinamibacterales bacterium]|nr:hypothetical protein [Vicinamibacterales bacterium]
MPFVARRFAPEFVGVTFIAALCLVSVSAQRGGGPGGGGPQTTQTVGNPRFEYVGPSSSGRIAAAAAVAGKPGTYYAGAASGGVWKSTDGGSTWKPTFDGQSSQAIGALAVSESNPNVVWAGTGEGWAVRDMDMMGDGIYKSTDAGETWTNMGLPQSGRIGTIVIDPRNENVVLACVLGRATGPQQERGVYRTEDGGRTWTQALFVNRDTGCSGLQFSHQDPNIVIAGTWEIQLQTHVLESGGMGSGIYLSKDNGRTFTKVTHPGLPKSPYGKTDVAIAPSDRNRMYALIQTGADGVKGLKSEAQGSVWRSDDGGATWANVSWDRRLIGRAGYYIRIRVSPDDPDHLLIANSSLWRSRDGGKIWTSGGGGCGDCHDIWWDTTPSMPGHYIVTGDGGMGIFGSPNNPTGNTGVSLPIGQMYRVTIDQRTPYWVYSDRQDDGSMRIDTSRPIVPGNVPSYAPASAPGGATAGPPAAAPAGGGRGGGAGARGGGAGGGAGAAGAGGGGAGRGGAAAGTAAAGDVNIAATAAQQGRGGGGGGRGGGDTTPAEQSMPSCESGYTYPEPNNSRFVWGTCYAAHVATYDELSGQTRSVSPWLHTLDSDPVNLKYRCHWSPPLAIDWFDNSVYFGCQLIFKTTNRGQSWEEFSPDLSTKDPSRIRFSGGVVGDNLGQFYGAVVSAIAPSRTQKGVVWAGTNDGKVWINRQGRNTTWVDVTKNVPMPPWGIVRRIDSSHFDPGTAYMAVDYHLVDNRDPYLFKTNDFGATWTRIDAGLPKGHPLDYALVVTENPNRKGMLFAGTGHGFFYSKDDGKTWTQFKDKLPAAPVNWIEVPKNAAEVAVATYGRGLWILRDLWKLEQDDQLDQAAELKLYKPRPGVRRNSSGTAEFVFALPSVPTSAITMEILGADGAVLSTSQINGRAGMNKATWNLLLKSSDRPVLRSVPPDNPHIWDAGRWPAHERPVTHWGIGSTNWQPRAAPGRYTVRLTYNNKSYTQPFEIWRDPMMPSTDVDLQASTSLQRNIIKSIDDVVNKINRIEIMREQVEKLRADAANKPSDAALAAIYDKMYNTELNYLTRTEMHSDDKWYVEKYKLYMNLIWMLGEVGGGASDVAGGVAYGPTSSQLNAYEDQLKELNAANAAFAKLMAEVEAFNKANAGKLPAISDKLGGGR